MNDLTKLRDEAAAVIEDALCVISGSGRTCEIHEERTDGGRCPRALSAADALLARLDRHEPADAPDDPPTDERKNR